MFVYQFGLISWLSYDFCDQDDDDDDDEEDAMDVVICVCLCARLQITFVVCRSSSSPKHITFC